LKFGVGAVGAAALEKTALGKTFQQEKEKTKESVAALEQELANAYDELMKVFERGQKEILNVAEKKFFPSGESTRYDALKMNQLKASFTVEERGRNQEIFLRFAQPSIEKFFLALGNYFRKTGRDKEEMGNFETQNSVYWAKMSEKEWAELPSGYQPAGCEKRVVNGETFYAIEDKLPISLVEIFQTLMRYDSHGLVYKFLSKEGMYKDPDGVLGDKTREWNGARMTYNSTHFLPSSKEITDKEIDPFLSFYDKRYEGASTYIIESKWRKNTYQQKFRLLLDDPKIRARLTREPDFTYADSCSLIKSVIEFRERGLARKMKDEEVLDFLIKERRKMENESWIDKDTNVIRFYAFDNAWKGSGGKNMFRTEPMDEILSVVGCKTDQVFEAQIDPKADENFFEAIEHSVGNTFISPHNHGEKDAWFVEGQHHNKVDRLAQALFMRMTNVFLKEGLEAACNTLSEVRLVAEACLAYDFLFKNLAPALKKEWENYIKTLVEMQSKPGWETEAKKSGFSDAFIANIKLIIGLKFEDIKLPRVVAFGQEGNVVYAYVEDKMAAHKEAYRKQGKIRGKDFLAIQSEVYALGGDMSFSSSKNGQIYQISEVEKYSEDRAV
jgi:hypothetical protein